MARIRTIKPDFWSDATLIECSLNARLLFIGTWNFADDFGNLDRSAKQINARIFPADSLDCEPLIAELIVHGLLIEYSVNEKKYLHIHGFAKHQVINRPGKPQCPLYESSLSTHGALTEHSRSIHGGREGKGREGKGKEGIKERAEHAPRSASPPPKASRFNLETPPEDWRAFCTAERPDLDPAKTFAAFGDYWRGVPGAKGNKLDWIATWRNWVRGEKRDRASGIVAPIADGKITCRACGERCSTYTDFRCDPCYRAGRMAA